jgi:hypothetical protein
MKESSVPGRRRGLEEQNGTAKPAKKALARRIKGKRYIEGNEEDAGVD